MRDYRFGALAALGHYMKQLMSDATNEITKHEILMKLLKVEQAIWQNEPAAALNLLALIPPTEADGYVSGVYKQCETELLALCRFLNEHGYPEIGQGPVVDIPSKGFDVNPD